MSSYGVHRTREKFMLLCVLNSLSGTNWTMSLLILVPCLSTSGLSSASKVSCKSKENSVPSWANKRYTIIMWVCVHTHTHTHTYTHKVEVVLTIFVKSAEPTPTMTIDSGSLEAATTLSIVLSMSVMTPSYTRRQRQHGLVN